MKQIRLVIILAVTAVVMVAGFFVVDHITKKQKERAEIGAAKQLLSIDSNDVTRITVDNEDGHFAFDWQDTGWVLVSEDQFPINTYAVAAICTYACNVSSEKTVAFDCEDTSIYGFDNPVTLKIYTTKTDEEHPYVIMVGDSTPTYDAYYAMIGGSNDVYTIDYNTGSIFCVAKNSLRNNYLFDVTTSMFTAYRLERGGKVITELKRGSDNNVVLTTPAGFDVSKVNIDDLIDRVTRVTFSEFIEDHPQDLAKYGLDDPHTKLFLEAQSNGQPIKEEIWFGKQTSDLDTADMYGYSATLDLVFTVKRNDVSFIDYDAKQYILPYCTNVELANLSSVEIDMGDVYDMHETLSLDSDNQKYAIGGTQITPEDEELFDLFTNYYRAIAFLRFTETDFDAVPQGDPAITITYTFRDGSTQVLTFIPESENNYWLMKDGKYTSLTVRLNRFTGTGCVTETYETLMNALRGK